MDFSQFLNVQYGYGFLLQYPLSGVVLGVVLVGLILGYLGTPLLVWAAFALASLWTLGAPVEVLIGTVAVLSIFIVTPIRSALISRTVMKILDALKLMPAISKTEQTALEAGATWMDGELFSGAPDFFKMMEQPYPSLTEEEQKFIDGPVEKLCKMCNDWKISTNKDLPQEAWDFIKQERFFGMIIPKQYGGLEFSALAHSAVVAKLSSRSVPLAVSVMVPNSLGPAELLIHYGTKEQKDYFLPRLAKGDEIPCFALTEPNAGSDAGSIESSGLVFKGSDGQLYVKLNWNKRYITLAAISTVLGLAVKLQDPENLLGQGKEPGITCLLIPSNTKGVVLGKRHNPMGVPFYNCPTEGHDVVVPVDHIIGGVQGTGQGWRMLMECLAAGRSISLPAQSTGGIKLAARVAGAYSGVRRQFGINIGKFEGIEEPLATIGGFAYLAEAMRVYTCGAVDQGIKPSVVSAIAKFNATELMRKAVTDGMDILGGAGISRGPKNLLANGYIAAPIGITVEGANILTRTMIIFGQGAIRCHPFAYAELKALLSNDVKAFDKAFWGHIGHVVRNGCRALVLSVTRGRFASSPVSGPAAKYFRKLAWTSATFAVFADLAMGAFGGDLKRKEKITGRYADVLSWMYISSAVLRRYLAQGQKAEHLPFVHWSMQYAFTQIQRGFDGLFENLDVPVLSHIIRGPIAMWSRLNRITSMPSDTLGHQIATVLQTPGALRDSITGGIYCPKDVNESIGALDNALEVITKADASIHRVRTAVKQGKLTKKPFDQLIQDAQQAGILDANEVENVRKAEKVRAEAIEVDSFTLNEFLTGFPEESSKKVRAA